MSSPLASICTIVRDGEASIIKTLQSVVDSNVADEIVIVDTGSTDNTVNLTIDFAKQHRELKWVIKGGVPDTWFAPGGICKDCRGFGEDETACLRCDGTGIKEGDGKRLLTHFDAARNTSFQYARGDWIGWIDCDEIITRSNNFKQTLEALPTNIESIACAKHCYTKNTYLEYNSIRFVRKNTGWFWTSRIHEYPTKTYGTYANYLNCPDLLFEHHPTGPWPNRSRDVAVIKYILSTDEDQFRLLVYLVSTLTDEGFLQQADRYVQRLIASSRSKNNSYDAAIIVGNLRRRQGENLEAIRVYNDAHKIDPTQGDAPLMLADTYFNINKTKAIEWYDRGTRLLVNKDESMRVVSNLALLNIHTKFKSIGILQNTL